MGGLAKVTKMELEIRRAVPGEAVRLSGIARAAKASWGYPAAWLSAWEASLRVAPEYVQHHLVWVAVHDGEMVGFYALEQRDDRWLLEHFWVEPGWQGRGVGRRLFDHALATVRAIRPGIVTIEADPNAAGFYARMGASESGSVAAPLEGEPGRRLPIFEVNVSAASPAELDGRSRHEPGEGGTARAGPTRG